MYRARALKETRGSRFHPARLNPPTIDKLVADGMDPVSGGRITPYTRDLSTSPLGG